MLQGRGGNRLALPWPRVYCIYMAQDAAPKGITTTKLDAQHEENGGVLKPGQPGYWQVWGARANDVEVGDLLMVRWDAKDGTHEIKEYEVAAITYGFPTKVRATDGRKFWLGALQHIIVLRYGDHNTLARSL